MIVLTVLAAALTLTPDGIGPARIGMTRAQVQRVLGRRFRHTAQPEAPNCTEEGLAGLPGVAFMFTKGRLSRVTLFEPSPARTPRGIGVGAARSLVERRYPGIKVDTHEYMEGTRARSLLYWVRPGRKGVRFLVGEDQRVSSIHAGLAEIEYVEGCM